MKYDVLQPDGTLFGRNLGNTPDEAPYTHATAIDIAANINGIVIPASQYCCGTPMIWTDTYGIRTHRCQLRRTHPEEPEI